MSSSLATPPPWPLNGPTGKKASYASAFQSAVVALTVWMTGAKGHQHNSPSTPPQEHHSSPVGPPQITSRKEYLPGVAPRKMG
eukprot:15459850-Alexandrium_andersonii.AAC.1